MSSASARHNASAGAASACAKMAYSIARWRATAPAFSPRLALDRGEDSTGSALVIGLDGASMASGDVEVLTRPNVDRLFDRDANQLRAMLVVADRFLVGHLICRDHDLGGAE